MRHSSLTEKQFAKNYEAVCNVAAEVYGRGHFDGDFISVKDTSEKDICETISHILKMNNNDVERLMPLILKWLKLHNDYVLLYDDGNYENTAVWWLTTEH